MQCAQKNHMHACETWNSSQLAGQCWSSSSRSNLSTNSCSLTEAAGEGASGAGAFGTGGGVGKLGGEGAPVFGGGPATEVPGASSPAGGKGAGGFTAAGLTTEASETPFARGGGGEKIGFWGSGVAAAQCSPICRCIISIWAFSKAYCSCITANSELHLGTTGAAVPRATFAVAAGSAGFFAGTPLTAVITGFSAGSSSKTKDPMRASSSSSSASGCVAGMSRSLSESTARTMPSWKTHLSKEMWCKLQGQARQPVRFAVPNFIRLSLQHCCPALQLLHVEELQGPSRDLPWPQQSWTVELLQ